MADRQSIIRTSLASGLFLQAFLFGWVFAFGQGDIPRFRAINFDECRRLGGEMEAGACTCLDLSAPGQPVRFTYDRTDLDRPLNCAQKTAARQAEAAQQNGRRSMQFPTQSVRRRERSAGAAASK